MNQRSVPLAKLTHDLGQATIAGGRADADITAIAIDSRDVVPGSIFVALRGEHTDGHRFIADAVERGAVAVVMESTHDIPADVSGIVVSDSALALSKIADAFYGSPSRSLTIAGVTGTNGKTTTSYFIAAAMNAGGMHAGVIGTTGAHFADRDRPLAHTTPPASELQALLAQMRESGIVGVAMEVSSHALALQRTADVRIAVGALTNVTRDHLDFHGTLEAYAAAKRSLFEQTEYCVFNADDEFGRRWSHEFRDRKPVLTYSLDQEADVRAEELELRIDGSRFRVGGNPFTIRIPGRYNVENALCAVGVARTIGIGDTEIARGLESVERVTGRMERIENREIGIVVDYAHTPDALQHLLIALRETAPRRLIVVFGCGGDRDRGKRAQMGEIAGRYADYVYLTSDNPRSEDPLSIIAQIEPGIGTAAHAIQPDRRRAIFEAIGSAQPGDLVAIAGKGHEKYQIVGSEVLPFDDAAVAREAVAQRESARV